MSTRSQNSLDIHMPDGGSQVCMGSKGYAGPIISIMTSYSANSGSIVSGGFNCQMSQVPIASVNAGAPNDVCRPCRCGLPRLLRLYRAPFALKWTLVYTRNSPSSYTSLKDRMTSMGWGTMKRIGYELTV